MSGDEAYIRETIENLKYMAAHEATLPAMADLDMAVMYLRHYLRVMTGDRELQKVT